MYTELVSGWTESEEILNSPNVLLVPGFGECAEHFDQLATALKSEGAQVTVTQSNENDILYSAETSGQPIHAVGHSLASVVLLDAALASPERFLSVTLMEPMGFNPGAGLFELIQKSGTKAMANQYEATRQLIQNLLGIIPAETDNYADECAGGLTITLNQLRSLCTVARSPFSSFQRLLRAMEADVGAKTKTVRALGIPVDVILAASDEIFDINEADQHCQPLIESGVTYTWLVDRRATHDVMWRQPFRTAKLIHQIITTSV